MGIYRPIGVIALAIILFTLAGLEIILGILIQTVGIPRIYQNLYMDYILLLYFINRPQDTGLGTNFNLSGYSYIQSEIIYLGTVFVMVLIFSGLSILACIGLLRMKNWGRYLGLTVGTFYIIIGAFLILGLFAYFSPTLGIYELLYSILFLAFGIGTLVYLSGDIKYEFQ